MTEARITVTQRKQYTLGERVSDALRATPTHRDDREIVRSARIDDVTDRYRVDVKGRSSGDVAIHFYHDPQNPDGDVKVKGKLFLTGKNGGYVELAPSTVIDGEIVIFKLGDTKETEIKVAHGIEKDANLRFNGTSSTFYNLPRITLKR